MSVNANLYDIVLYHDHAPGHLQEILFPARAPVYLPLFKKGNDGSMVAQHLELAQHPRKEDAVHVQVPRNPG